MANDNPDLDGGDNSEAIAKDQLRAFVERVERMEDSLIDAGPDVLDVRQRNVDSAVCLVHQLQFVGFGIDVLKLESGPGLLFEIGRDPWQVCTVALPNGHREGVVTPSRAGRERTRTESDRDRYG